MRELCFLCPGNPPGWGRDRLLPGACLSRLTLRLAAGGRLLLVRMGRGLGRLSRRVEHTVRKTIYIEANAAPAGGGGATNA